MEDGKGDDVSMKLKWIQPDMNGSAAAGSFRSLRIRTKLWLTLVPAVVTILAVTGYVTHWFSRQFLQEAVRRTVLLQTLAVAHEYETMMSRCREDVVELSLGAVTEEGLRKKWAHLKAARGWSYVEMGFMDKNGSRAMILAESEEGLERVSLEPGTSLWDGVEIPSAQTQGPSKGEAGPWMSSVVHVGYRSSDGSAFYGKATHVVRFISRSESRDGQGDEGFVFVSMDARQWRDILSLYNSRRSPLLGFVRSPELRYLYFMDPQGWILFQSEDQVNSNKALNTDTARSGLTGTFGRPGLPFAFRPNVDQRDYWEIVGDIREMKSGVLVRRISPAPDSKVDRVYIGYAPIFFSRGPNTDGASLYGAVVFVDRSRLITMAGYRQVDVMFIISLLSSVLVVLLLWGISRVITRPLYQLTAAVNALQESGHLEPIEIPDKDLETAMLKEAVNGLIQRLQEQVAAMEMQDRQLREMIMRERISLEEESDLLRVEREKLPEPLARLVGQSRAMQRFREFVIRAAAAEADVLIIGETGTGKQLAAEAIHALSRRASQPFVAINCGALDENLLLDALFGHVKGAFSEAKGDRKGAFLAADGGTLFLDEIGTASPKVQQALLRVIAERRVRPLGSDTEIPVDVRLVAATNEDLLDLTRRGLFREDLYYRLNVLTLHTPPLRERREDIPLLAAHFLARAGRQFKRPNVSLTQGALEALMAHLWPGNVRELENRLTRAVAMAEGSLIHAFDLEMDRDPLMNGSDSVDTLEGVLETRAKGTSADGGELDAARFDEGKTNEPKPSSKGGSSSAVVEINERQRKALGAILERGHLTRAEYQEIVRGGIAPRTALSDLQDLVAKGLLKKTGRGPATRYRLLHRGRLVASGNQTFGGSS